MINQGTTVDETSVTKERIKITVNTVEAGSHFYDDCFYTIAFGWFKIFHREAGVKKDYTCTIYSPNEVATIVIEGERPRRG